MRSWRRVLAGRAARIVLSSVMVCGFWLCAFFFGLSATRGVTAEEMMDNSPVQDAQWVASHGALERLAARESKAGEVLLIAGAGAALLLGIRRRFYRPARSSWRRTAMLVLVVVCGMVGMLLLGLWVPAGGGR